MAGRFLSEVFWQRLYEQVEKQPDPPYMPHAVMARAFKAAESQWARPDWLQQSLRRYAADDDTSTARDLGDEADRRMEVAAHFITDRDRTDALWLRQNA